MSNGTIHYKPIHVFNMSLSALALWKPARVYSLVVHFKFFVVIFRRHADERFRLLRSMLPSVCLFVCHFRALCSNSRRYRRRHDVFCTR